MEYLVPKNDSHKYPILYGCTNNQNREESFNNLQILLNIGCIYLVIMDNIMLKLRKKNALLQSGRNKPEFSQPIIKLKLFLE